MTTKVSIKKLVPSAVIPSYAKYGDAGLDLTATSKEYSHELQSWVYGTGIAVAIPEGYVGLIFPRSSIRKTNLLLSNSVGVIDSGYRGEITFSFKRNLTFENSDMEMLLSSFCSYISDAEFAYKDKSQADALALDIKEWKEGVDGIEALPEYEIGDRVGQLIIIPIPFIVFDEVDELDETERGDGGYGSTGR